MVTEPQQGKQTTHVHKHATERNNMKPMNMEMTLSYRKAQGILAQFQCRSGSVTGNTTRDRRQMF